MTTDIKPDTSLYPHDMPSRLRAQALIIEGQRAGRTVQVRPHGDAGWHDGSWSVDSYRIDYRLKPEPRVVWVNFYGDGRNYHYSSEEVAKRAAIGCNSSHIATAVRVELPE